eukprot:7277655-Pyramimonas_sp.AAC.1
MPLPAFRLAMVAENDGAVVVARLGRRSRLLAVVVGLGCDRDHEAGVAGVGPDLALAHLVATRDGQG